MERHYQVAGTGTFAFRSPRVKMEDDLQRRWRMTKLTSRGTSRPRLRWLNQPHMAVVNRQQEEAVALDVAIPGDGDVKRKEKNTEGAERGARKKRWKVKATVVPVVVGALGGQDPQAGRVAPANCSNHIQDLGPEERKSYRNSYAGAQNPQDPSLKDLLPVILEVWGINVTSFHVMHLY